MEVSLFVLISVGEIAVIPAVRYKTVNCLRFISVFVSTNDMYYVMLIFLVLYLVISYVCSSWVNISVK